MIYFKTMVKIRLAQTGTTNRKTYRIVVMNERDRRDGRAIETVGFYDPLVKPPKLTIDRERVAFWVGRGAQVSEGLGKLLTPAKP